MKLTKRLVLDYLKKHKLMTIATYGKHPWISQVYYSFDKDLNLYFLSAPRTLHSKQIVKNKHVAVAIADSRQKPSDLKKGLQIYGVAKPIKNRMKIRHALRLWKDALKVKNPKLTYENMIRKPNEGTMYQVTPKRIKFFNQELFKMKDGKEPVLDL